MVFHRKKKKLIKAFPFKNERTGSTSQYPGHAVWHIERFNVPLKELISDAWHTF